MRPSALTVAAVLLSMTCVSAAATSRRVLIIDQHGTQFGKACAAVLSAMPDHHATVAGPDEASVLAALRRPCDVVIAVCTDPATWNTATADAWRDLCHSRSTGIVLAGLPKEDAGRKALLASLGPRNPAKVRMSIAGRFAGASWVWPQPEAMGAVRLRRVFDVKQVPAFAPLQVSADDGGKAWLNGKPLGEIRNWREPLGMDVSARLRQGVNVLCVEAANQDGAGGVIAALRGYSADGELAVEELSSRAWRASLSAPTSDDWVAAGFDDSNWSAASEIAPMSQGPWQGNMPDVPDLFNQAMLLADTDHPALLGLPADLGSMTVRDILEPASAATVLLRAGCFPAAVALDAAMGRSVAVAAIPELPWHTTARTPAGSNAFWDFFVQAIRWADGRQSMAIRGCYIPRIVVGGRPWELAGDVEPSSAKLTARVTILSGDEVLLQAQKAVPASGRIRFPVVLPRAVEADGSLLAVLIVHDAAGTLLAARSGFVCMSDVVPIEVAGTTVRRVFRTDEPIEFRAAPAHPLPAAGRWEARFITLSGGQKLPALPPLHRSDAAQWRIEPASLAPGVYAAEVTLAASDDADPLGQARYSFEVVPRRGAEFVPQPPPHADGLLRVVCLNVNVNNDIGDAHLIITPGGKVMLIDAGMPGYGLSVVLPYLKAHNIRTIDWMMPSHMHDDHFGGMAELILSEELTVKQLLWSPLPAEAMREMEAMYAEDSERIMGSIESACRKRDVPVTVLRAGQTLDLGDGVSGEILAAAEPEVPVGNYVNNNSVIMLLRYGDFSMMFTGDQGFEQEQRVMKLGRDLTCDVLKIAHHAGAGSTGEDWVSALAPKVGIAPMPEFLSNDPRGQRVYNQLIPTGIKLYRTWECGHIQTCTDGERFWIATEKGAAAPALPVKP